MMFKWVFKTFMAVIILSNAINIVMAVFDVTQSVVNSSAGIIGGSTSISPVVLAELENELMALDIGPLLGLMVQSFIAQGTTLAVGFVIFIIVYGRRIEIYLLISLAPIPLVTLSNREFGSMRQNYFKSLCAIGFQGVLIIVCVAIYAVMIQSIGTATSDGIFGAIWAAMGYTLLLCFTLFKTDSPRQSHFGSELTDFGQFGPKWKGVTTMTEKAAAPLDFTVSVRPIGPQWRPRPATLFVPACSLSVRPATAARWFPGR